MNNYIARSICCLLSISQASASFSVLPQDLNLASMEQFYKVFGPNSITNQEQQTDKRAAPGPQRVFIPYIFKRGYEPADDVFEPMEYDDMKSGNEIEKRGASQYYLLHFGMPGSGARAPAQQKTRSYKRTNENGRRQYRSYRQRAQRSF